MENRGHIDNASAFFLIASAIIIDAIQAGLDIIVVGVILNPVIDILVGAMFGLWFWHLGVNMFSVKNFGPFVGVFLLELIPGINALPLWTADVVLTIAQNRAKDKLSR